MFRSRWRSTAATIPTARCSLLRLRNDFRYTLNEGYVTRGYFEDTFHKLLTSVTPTMITLFKMEYCYIQVWKIHIKKEIRRKINGFNAANRWRYESKQRHLHGDSVNYSTFITVRLTATDFNHRVHKLSTNTHCLYFACLEVSKRTWRHITLLNSASLYLWLKSISVL